ncbi:MAG TPA: FAD-binding oxidoreductase, partial [Anaerolineaceae bacterium]|nr:FAD-binding oxidoreductase [Anaerolineaceae bacterium]
MNILSESDIARLRSEFAGQVIPPGDPAYDAGRVLFYGGFENRRPAVIIRAASDQDVARAVSLARETGLPLAVRSGGHSPAGLSLIDGGILLDLKGLNNLHIDPEGRTAWAESGLTTGEYTSAAAEYGLATGFGDTGTVGIGGLTLGGGVGYLVRKYGLTIDNLLAADLVTADGQLLRVDSGNHPDLFWAIRGGGGNFGVVTRFLFRLQEVPSMLGGLLVLAATAETLARIVDA